MNINDFNGTIPDGRANPPDESDWGKDMEQEKSCDGCKYEELCCDEFPCDRCMRLNSKVDHYEPIPSPEGNPMAKKKHKSCPFCGGNELVSDGHFVGCDDCGAAGPCTYPVPDDEKSWELWDRRAEQKEEK
jgi:hypothetical protein